MATGRLFGVGLGAGREKTGYLPNAHTDFIFAVIGEEVGLIGCLVVVALFVGFVFLGVRAAARAPDRFGMLVATGVTAWVVLQALVNVGAVVGLLPVTGVPLPFVSFGGSSTGKVGGAVPASTASGSPRLRSPRGRSRFSFRRVMRTRLMRRGSASRTSNSNSPGPGINSPRTGRRPAHVTR
jgi:hypothetical protein